MSERMNKERAIELLKNDCCYECSWGCRNPIECNNKECDYRQAIIIAIESVDENERLKKERDYLLEKAKLEKVKAELKDNEWVDVRDRLPQKKGLYLVTNFDLVSYTTWTTTSYFNNNAFELDGVIAWKPLPQPYVRKE